MIDWSIKLALLTSWLCRPPLFYWFNRAMLLCMWIAACEVGETPLLSYFWSIMRFIDCVFLIFMASICLFLDPVAFALTSFEYSGLCIILLKLTSRSIVSGPPADESTY